jgi:hypothetical protein
LANKEIIACCPLLIARCLKKGQSANVKESKAYFLAKREELINNSEPEKERKKLAILYDFLFHNQLSFFIYR